MKKLVLIMVLCCLLLVSCTGGDVIKPSNDSTNSESTQDTSDKTPETEGQPDEDGETVLKVMSFNVLYKDINTTAANDERIKVVNSVQNRKKQINDMLLGENIDVVGFQEITSAWFQRFSWLDERYAYIGGTNGEDGDGEGGYIVYNKNKLEVLKSGKFWLAQGAPTTYTKMAAADFPRICSWGIFKVKETGAVFVFMNTHMSYVSAVQSVMTTAIIEQTTALRTLAYEECGAVKNCPLVLVGDMNMSGNDQPLEMLKTTLRDARVYSVGATVPANHSSARAFYHCNSLDDVPQDSLVLDYIFISKKITVKNFEMFYTTTNLCEYGEYMSDHNAVAAEIAF